MKAVDWINESYPSLSVHDTIDEALGKLQESEPLYELPLRREDGTFGGFFIASKVPKDAPRSSLAAQYCVRKKAQIRDEASHYDVIQVAHLHGGSSSVAVVDAKNLYIGTIAPQDVLAGMSFFSSVRSPGTVLGIQMRQEDYSLAEISRLTEENEAKILSLSMIQCSEDPHQIYLVLKLNVQDGAAVRKTLTRHGYQVSHHQVISDQSDLGDQKNYKYLMKYLSV